MTKVKIDPDMNMLDFILEYPQLVDVLSEEYGFHCVNCMFSGMDTFRQGAEIHDIKGEDLEEMIENLEKIINSNTDL